VSRNVVCVRRRLDKTIPHFLVPQQAHPFLLLL
jgi:hypothetical protein